MLRLIAVILGIGLFSGVAFAQAGGQSSNPYLAEMQKQLNAANREAMNQFNQQYPQPEVSTVDTSKATKNAPSTFKSEGSKNTTTTTTSTSTTGSQKKSTQTYQEEDQSTQLNTVAAKPPQEIAVTSTDKDNEKDKKSGIFNIFAPKGSSSSNSQGSQNQSQGPTNIFR